jgi:hypothetical protein
MMISLFTWNGDKVVRYFPTESKPVLIRGEDCHLSVSLESRFAS